MDTSLKGRKILVGVTGSIAAYKSPLLVRELVKAGAEVKVVMTPSAKHFVTPMILSNLSRNPVASDMFESSSQAEGAWHIHLVHWCNLMIIAPCSATTLGRIANGICDNALAALATALPGTTPLLIAPAMDFTMLNHPVTRRNIRFLEENGAIIIPPEEGELSSGLVGPGRLPDVDVLLQYIKKHIKSDNEANEAAAKSIEDLKQPEYRESDYEARLREVMEKPAETLQDSVDKDAWSVEYDLEILKQKFNGEMPGKFLLGKKVLITAGPTFERIDDVRFIGNFSSGRMGFALAEQAARAGANVVLIAGPVSLGTPPGVKRIDVESADEMFDVAVKEFPFMDIAVLSAAVADFTPINPVKGKIKKSDTGDRLTIELQTTNDILATLGTMKKESQYLAGFALESINEIENGWKKLKDKNCDMMVVNSATKPDSGFRGDLNTITILTTDGKEDSLPTMSKAACSAIILKKISDRLI